MTLLQLINTIKTIALAQPNIHSFCGEFLDLNDVTAKYSAVILQQITHRRNNDFITYSFYLGYSDRLNEDKSNEVEIQSTAIQVIDSIVYSLENMNIDTALGSYNTFTQRFLAEAAGAYAEINISVPVGECTDDFSKEDLDTTITKNGVYSWIPNGLGYSNVKINVDVSQTKLNNQKKSAVVNKNNKRYTYKPDEGYTGLDEVSVMVQINEIPIFEEGYVQGREDGWNEQKRKLTDIEIVENGTYEREDGYKKVEVNVPTVNNQEKSITITENGQTDITPDPDYTGLSKVGVNVNIDTQSYYDNGYSQGKTDGKVEGIAEQKSKLTDLNITENGTYTREDGYKSVVADIHPTEKLERTYIENGQYLIDGEYAGGEINVNVPSDKKPEIELTKTLTANDTYTYTPDEGTVYNKVNITTDIHPTEKLNRTYVENNTYIIEGEYNGGEITVNVDTQGAYNQGYADGETKGKEDGIAEQKAKLTDITITTNGTYTKTDGYKSVNVNVPTVNNQEKSITINSNGTSSVVPDTGYTGINKIDITVDVPTSGGEGIDLTSLGYNTQENTGINTDIQDSIAYSQSLLDNYTNSTLYEDDYNLLFAPKIPCENRSDFRNLFLKCYSLLSVPFIDTSNGKLFVQMFNQCTSLTEIPEINTSRGTTFGHMFYGCVALKNIPSLNTQNGFDFGSMFAYCYSLAGDIELDTSRGITFANMFLMCENINSVNLTSTAQSSTFNHMFRGCEKLTSIHTLNVSNSDSDMTTIFKNCYELTDITFTGLINKDISFTDCKKLSFDSIKSILTACSNTTNTDAKTVSFNRTIADQGNELTNLVTSCTEKGWTVTALTITTE